MKDSKGLLVSMKRFLEIYEKENRNVRNANRFVATEIYHNVPESINAIDKPCANCKHDGEQNSCGSHCQDCNRNFTFADNYEVKK